MIILPTEKAINWKRPPVVLIGLVILNILVFALYQSGDRQKMADAAGIYQQHNFVNLEKDVYLDYLQSINFSIEHSDEFLGYQTLVETQPKYLINTFISDRAFYQYLLAHQDEWLPARKADTWIKYRPLVQEKMMETSYLANGLIPQDRNIFALISHQFLHGDIFHLLGNMVFLIICGFAVEAALGSIKFLVFYLLSGIAGGMLYSLIEVATGNGTVPLVGASGAISGVMAMYVTLFRLQKIEFFYWIFIFVGYFRAPALLILPLYIVNELISYFQQDLSSVAYMAHTGGFIAGGLLVWLAMLQSPDSINQEYLEDDQEKNEEQIQLDKIYRLIESYQFQNALNKIQKYKEQFGSTPQLELMQYQLLTTQDLPFEDIAKQAIKILTLKDRSHTTIQQQLKVWTQSSVEVKPIIQQTLSNNNKINLALHFTEIDKFVEAEKIAKDLMKEHCQELMLAKLLRNLADFYQDNASLREQYQSTADSLLASHQKKQSEQGSHL